MKKRCVCFAAMTFTAGAALAADLPLRKGPEVQPPPSLPMWTGFYAGVNAGGTWSNNSSVLIGAAPVYANPGAVPPAGSIALANALASVSNSYISGSSNGGFMGGGQIGYNYQLQNSFLLGLEADIQGIASSSSSARVLTSTTLAAWGYPDEFITAAAAARRNVSYLGTVRGRLGLLATPTLLIYATGGLAYGGVNLNTASVAQDKYDFAYPAVLGGTNYSSTQVGWTAGGGVEWAFMPNVSAKVEYLYYDLGNVAQTSAISQWNNFRSQTWAIVGTRTSASFSGNVVRAGVNYHFNWGSVAPVIAKY